MALITAVELIEEVYRRMAQDVEIAQSEIAADDDNPTFPRDVVLAYLNAEEAEFRSRLSGHTSLWRGYAEIDIAEGIVALPDDYQSDLQLTVWRSDTQPENVVDAVEESWLDEHTPTWRNETADTPSQYIIKQTTVEVDEVDVPTLGVYCVPQPDATIADGLRGPYTVKATEMVDDDDQCTSMLAFPQIQRTVLPYGVLEKLWEYKVSAQALQLAEHYRKLKEKEIGVARRICSQLARRTHTNARRS